MFGVNRWNSFGDVFNFQRDLDRAFNQFWNDLPTRTANASWLASSNVSSRCPRADAAVRDRAARTPFRRRYLIARYSMPLTATSPIERSSRF